jgi:hypothetical protein
MPRSQSRNGIALGWLADGLKEGRPAVANPLDDRRVPLQPGGAAMGAPTHTANPLIGVRIPLHEVQLEGADGGPARLTWTKAAAKFRDNLDGCLPAFIRLADASDGRILEFARCWGVLGICACGMPGIHDGCPPLGEAEESWRSSAQQSASPKLLWEPNDRFWEPTSAWRRHARMMGAVLELAFNLQEGNDSDAKVWVDAQPTPILRSLPVDWESVYQHPTSRDWKIVDMVRSDLTSSGGKVDNRGKLLSDELERQRQWLAAILTVLARRAGLEPTVAWTGRGFSFTLTLGERSGATPADRANAFAWPGERLYSILVCKLVATVMSGRGTYQCKSCLSYFAPEEGKRRPRSGLCPECNRMSRLADKAADSRRYRAKSKIQA